jgi:hypothetical protein
MVSVNTSSWDDTKCRAYGRMDHRYQAMVKAHLVSWAKNGRLCLQVFKMYVGVIPLKNSP